MLNFIKPSRLFAGNVLVLWASWWLSVGSLSGESMGPKNVLIFFIDDLRPELGSYGVDYIQTPHMDALAAAGVLFERAYCQQGVCAPSRISMLTGQYPDTTGIYDLFTPLRSKHPDTMTMPRFFKNRGYFTASYGKVYHHHTDDKESWSDLPVVPGAKYADPETLRSIERRTEAAKAQGLTGLALWSVSQGPATEAFDVDDAGYRDGAVAEQVIASLRRHRDTPFFMGVGFAKPHLPFAAPQRYWDLYERDQFAVPDHTLPAGTPALAVTQWNELRAYEGIPAEGPLTDDQTRELKHGYAASVSYADAQVGRVLTELDRLGLREQTIVVLWGDHGYKLGDYGLWCKHTNLELDTRVPLIVSAPGFPPGTRSSALVEIVDIFPTVAELTGGQVPASCDGLSLTEVMRNPRKALRPFALSQYPRGKLMGYSLRDERWRYTEWVDMESRQLVTQELYDHRETQTPTRNLAADPDHAEWVATLSRLLNVDQRLRQMATMNNPPAAKIPDRTKNL